MNDSRQACVILRDILTLQRVPGVGNKSIVELIKFYRANKLTSIDDLFSVDLAGISQLKRANTSIKKFLADGQYEKTRQECELLLDKWLSSGIELVGFGSSDYPAPLKELNDPPAVLFCRGNLALLNSTKSIAVVGTRENTHLGEKISMRTVEHFGRLGYCIVSGLAMGIDTIAHRSALVNKCPTVAVLVDVLNVMPAQNRTLADQIIDSNGLLISENPPNTKVIPALFAKRDRIQAGLALAVFAIETAIDGGTMHAVAAANSIHRPVYVPDAVAAKYTDLEERAISGTQLLVKQGKAKPYSRKSYDQIARELSEQAIRLLTPYVEPGGLL